MGRVNKYLVGHFFTIFGSLFMTLFFIMSIVFFIQISRVTSVIEISFFELGKLYIYMLPQILIFTIPIGFFIALSLTFFRLSKENETIVLFTLGYPPKKIALFFLSFAFVVSLLLLVTALIFIPLSRQLNKNFTDYKRSEASINIKATEFGQRFSNWMVFVEGESIEDEGRIYENIIMYSQSPQNERLILSEKATIINDGGELKLNLNQGRAYELLAEKLHEVAFKTMLIFTFPTDTVDDVESLWDYWADMDKDHKKAKNFSLYTLISLFPLATVLFSLSMGIVTYRYQRGGIYGAIFVILFAYFASIMLISKNIPIYGIGFVFGLFFLLSLVIFRQKILKRF